ncbi:MAG: hypothetical protein EOO69_06620 [Moraxellaceae bacterium]|nr:MAG: hypothetical protein EOO69_06620 [Moraxellaceae bacterium]
MQNARQHAILTALGIRQWVPRAIATTALPSVALWRHASDALDNNNKLDNTNNLDSHALEKNHEPEQVAQLTTATADPRIHESANRMVQPEVVTTIEADHQHYHHDPLQFDQPQQAAKPSPDLVKQLPTPDVIQNIGQDTDVIETEISATTHLYSFRLQACEINQWIVLVNEADLQNPQLNSLWKNILLAFRQPEVNHFSWPLSEGQRWQRMTGSKAALNGLLFRLGLDKRVGLMSELADEVCPDRIERLPHLSELIEQPLKKRLLWQLLNNQ